jgi:hypothetical protein
LLAPEILPLETLANVAVGEVTQVAPPLAAWNHSLAPYRPLHPAGPPFAPAQQPAYLADPPPTIHRPQYSLRPEGQPSTALTLLARPNVPVQSEHTHTPPLALASTQPEQRTPDPYDIVWTARDNLEAFKRLRTEGRLLERYGEVPQAMNHIRQIIADVRHCPDSLKDRVVKVAAEYAEFFLEALPEDNVANHVEDVRMLILPINQQPQIWGDSVSRLNRAWTMLDECRRKLDGHESIPATPTTSTSSAPPPDQRLQHSVSQHWPRPPTVERTPEPETSAQSGKNLIGGTSLIPTSSVMSARALEKMPEYAAQHYRPEADSPREMTVEETLEPGTSAQSGTTLIVSREPRSQTEPPHTHHKPTHGHHLGSQYDGPVKRPASATLEHEGPPMKQQRTTLFAKPIPRRPKSSEELRLELERRHHEDAAFMERNPGPPEDDEGDGVQLGPRPPPSRAVSENDHAIIVSLTPALEDLRTGDLPRQPTPPRQYWTPPPIPPRPPYIVHPAPVVPHNVPPAPVVPPNMPPAPVVPPNIPPPPPIGPHPVFQPPPDPDFVQHPPVEFAQFNNMPGNPMANQIHPMPVDSLDLIDLMNMRNRDSAVLRPELRSFYVPQGQRRLESWDPARPRPHHALNDEHQLEFHQMFEMKRRQLEEVGRYTNFIRGVAEPESKTMVRLRFTTPGEGCNDEEFFSPPGSYLTLNGTPLRIPEVTYPRGFI